ncbi:hypothetical protein [Micromonospora lupini]|uniref:hypothetical protein n=1 Tax=Micromonospora lupini TaxID=285679 RepID=UPI0002E342A2|nr:hypothetical protein [Micromonospora lupini]
MTTHQPSHPDPDGLDDLDDLVLTWRSFVTKDAIEDDDEAARLVPPPPVAPPPPPPSS